MEAKEILVEQLVQKAAAESTCQKRITVCVIYDKEGNILVVESNRCEPEGGICERLKVVEEKKNYSEKSCNWMHAEIRAVARLFEVNKPYRAVLYGHEFFCINCEKALREAGVEVFEVASNGCGTGLRDLNS